MSKGQRKDKKLFDTFALEPETATLSSEISRELSLVSVSASLDFAWIHLFLWESRFAFVKNLREKDGKSSEDIGKKAVCGGKFWFGVGIMKWREENREQEGDGEVDMVSGWVDTGMLLCFPINFFKKKMLKKTKNCFKNKYHFCFYFLKIERQNPRPKPWEELKLKAVSKWELFHSIREFLRDGGRCPTLLSIPNSSVRTAAPATDFRVLMLQGSCSLTVTSNANKCPSPSSWPCFHLVCNLWTLEDGFHCFLASNTCFLWVWFWVSLSLSLIPDFFLVAAWPSCLVVAPKWLFYRFCSWKSRRSPGGTGIECFFLMHWRLYYGNCLLGWHCSCNQLIISWFLIAYVFKNDMFHNSLTWYVEIDSRTSILGCCQQNQLVCLNFILVT